MVSLEQTEHSEIETLRFTRALFGLAPSPFLLSSVIEHHLDTWEAHEPHVVVATHVVAEEPLRG